MGLSGEWSSPRALALASAAGRLEDVPVLATQVEEACRPCPESDLVDRLTALGMSMAPNRPQAEATMWLHEMARLLADIPRDIVCGAIDDLQKRMKFLPTVAEIRALADPKVTDRRKIRSRLEAMRRYLESGQPIPSLPAARPARRITDDRPISADEAARLNEYLTRAGASTRYRDDGSTFQVRPENSAPKRLPTGPRRSPTRSDYLELGVDPAVLDGIEAERRQAETG